MEILDKDSGDRGIAEQNNADHSRESLEVDDTPSCGRIFSRWFDFLRNFPDPVPTRVTINE